MKTRTRFGWKDAYQIELRGLSHSELYARHAAFENLNSNVASDRTLECALMVRSEVARRENETAAALGIEGSE